MVVLFLARTFEKPEKVRKNLFFPNIASWGPKGPKNTKNSILGIFFVLWPKWLKNFQNFRHFFDFCTNHERSIFAIKKFLFFSRKIAKIWQILTSFSDSYKKSARAKTAPDWRHTGWYFLKIEKLPKFVKFRQIFKKKTNWWRHFYA